MDSETSNPLYYNSCQFQPNTKAKYGSPYLLLHAIRRRLSEYHSLRKLDTADLDRRHRIIPDAQNTRLDCRYVLPALHMV